MQDFLVRICSDELGGSIVQNDVSSVSVFAPLLIHLLSTPKPVERDLKGPNSLIILPFFQNLLMWFNMRMSYVDTFFRSWHDMLYVGV
jgi:hypothetical protein